MSECGLCDKGFPVEHGEHYGTQSLGMIPTTPCRQPVPRDEARRLLAAPWRFSTEVEVCPVCGDKPCSDEKRCERSAYMEAHGP